MSGDYVKERCQEAREVVQDAADGLDVKLPGWWKAVDLDGLNMFSCTDCVLGQIGMKLCYDAIEETMAHVDGDAYSAVYDWLFGCNDGKYGCDLHEMVNAFQPPVTQTEARDGTTLDKMVWAAYDGQWRREIEKRQARPEPRKIVIPQRRSTTSREVPVVVKT